MALDVEAKLSERPVPRDLFSPCVQLSSRLEERVANSHLVILL